ncbi:THO complex subunit 1 [Schistocerca cancellata]|uniref:THO complex subunit 1 n=1 Tax=Schistocerca cancellata TaxID=274614 RepID=UPI002119883F|nr:THO complex subunit 1 [Schistocerca cancellata]
MHGFDLMRAQFKEILNTQGFDRQALDVLKRNYDMFQANDADKHSALDQAVREHLLSLLCEDSDVTVLEQYVKFCIQACRLDMCTPTMPVVVLGDIFDALTLDRCETLFAFVENGVSVWKEELFFSACKNNLLRMCNDLLRRLSRSQNTVFCGRILLFLAKFFPFSERSGLNIVSEFNLDNITEFGGERTSDLKDILDDDAAGEEESKPDAKFKIDYNLYCKFWALQDFFRNPNQCYNKVHWKTFSAHATNVLLAFSSFKLDDNQGKKNRRSYQAVPAALGADINSDKTPNYFAKFLTNQKLLELQLSDSNFRRYVLVQFLIVFQYLESPVKFKSESHELKTDQVEWVKETTDMVYNLLAETPPDGPSFVRAVKHILKREEHWNSWKNEGCPSFQKPSAASDEAGGSTTGSDGLTIATGPAVVSADRKKQSTPKKRVKKKLGDTLRDATNHNKFFMGNTELTKLWNVYPNNMDACRSKDRDFLPTLESYFQEAIEQLDPAAQVEDEYKKVFDANFGWRALRLLARRSPHFFTHSNNPIHKLSDYLETMIKKVARDRPMSASATAVDETRGGVEVLEAENKEEEEELLKTEVKEEETEPEEGESDHHMHDSHDRHPTPPPRKPTQAQLSAVASLLGEDWKKLAYKLDFSSEVEFFESEHPTDAERAKHMLQIWAEEDDGANPEFLAYILEGLGCHSAAKVLKEPSP